ncbi:MAG: bacterioferritin [Bacteroidota bacterium]|nr:bacterioferritin [Bacteroidota bacterium]
MKGNEKLLTALNSLLAEELTAINQYMVHSEMCENWGYNKLHKTIEKQAVEEMHHAEWLIERILFFDGSPTVSYLNKIKIGKTVTEIIDYDYDAELDAVKSYNNAIKIAREIGDKGTDDLLTKILKMEENHVDWAEKQKAQIDQMGMDNYLTIQTESIVKTD